MPAMAGLHVRRVVVAALCCAALAAVTLGSPMVGPEPFRCAPCTPERLSQCPAVAPGCAEVLREPGCGCCLACALKRGEMCGIYTAPCGSGLKCTPRPDDPRPLHSLTRGQAVCAEVTAQEPIPELQTQGRPRDSTPSSSSSPLSSSLLHLCASFHLLTHLPSRPSIRSGRVGGGDGQHSRHPGHRPLPRRSQ